MALLDAKIRGEGQERVHRSRLTGKRTSGCVPRPRQRERHPRWHPWRGVAGLQILPGRSRSARNYNPAPPPPHSAPLPAEEVHAGRRLTEALVGLAAEHAREQGISISRVRRDAVIVAALVTAPRLSQRSDSAGASLRSRGVRGIPDELRRPRLPVRVAPARLPLTLPDEGRRRGYRHRPPRGP